ncbi:hypothetical protein BN1356_00939 [Streptococcus varani]|uniref:Uncharacterized protein n=1 Tax=Streptococcus varani TaxID=1608583 RepID=A0A0E4CSI9_9STRE|nr:hypothetical protein [Streptococcus varani]CQR24595.1 hypothetical protein BN1356_00939 [Streptococcus varani]
MIKITAYTANRRIEKFIKSSEEALKLRTKFQSQMNNGHTVSFDSALLNPSHIEAITFEGIEDEEAEHG